MKLSKFSNCGLGDNSIMRREIPPMHYRKLGHTGLSVSLISLGSGGPNQFGQKKYTPRAHVTDLVRFAFEMGINFFDTAPAYGESEAILGEALKEVPRDMVIIATKFSPILIETVERSLKRLHTDIIDLLQFHIVTPDLYRKATESLMPTLENLKEQGKFRFLGITESTTRDRDHEMLGMALEDDIFDTIMVAYGPMNPTAEVNILRTAGEKEVGVLCVASVREMAQLFRCTGGNIPGLIGKNSDVLAVHRTNVLGHSVMASWEVSNPALGYIYPISHPAVSTVITGTTNIKHLVNNARAILFNS
jgi:aryl-alcohol dehydrogenase-like predicted oxidoreductase